MNKVPIVSEFMTKTVITVSPDMVIYDGIKVLLDHKISGAPVVDSDSVGLKVVGMLSEKDCLSTLVNGVFYGLHSAKVSDYMTHPVVTVAPDTDIFGVAAEFLQHVYRRLPVVDDDGYLIGLVSRRDILNASRAMWGETIVPPDPGYLTDEVKAKLGLAGTSHISKKTQY